MNDNSDIFQITGTTLDIESQVSKLNDDINIKMRASSVAEGTGENEKPLTTGSIYNNNQIVRGAIDYKQWEGTILSIEDENRFLAKVQDVAGHDLPKIIRFDRRKVIFENGAMFAEGASFYWKVGLFYNDKGMATKRSEIRFRLLPPPNPVLLKVAEDEMNRIFDMLSWID